VKALKDCDENRVIQERIDANRESEIARLTESLEMVERDAAEAEIRHTSMNTKVMEEENRRSNEVESVMTQTDTSGAEVTEGVHAVPKASEQKVLDESEADEGDDWDLPFDEHQEFCSECRKLGRFCFVCRKYREGDVIEEAHMVRFTQAIELTPANSIEEVQGRYCDEIKPEVGLFPDDWHAAQRGKVRWYPIKLDGRAMSITRDSGAIEYIAWPGIICAKEDSDVKVAMNAYAVQAANM
jgi:hypothetical protein